MQALWNNRKFSELDSREVYEILKLRQDVFIVEQRCIWQDIDGADSNCIHITGRIRDELGAYARIIPPGKGDLEVELSRIVTARQFRGKGLGKQLMEETLQVCRQRFPDDPIKMEAQFYLIKFYKTFGFTVQGEKYLLDGIPHILMKKNS